jgi:predicted peroxiredoxin
MKQFLMMLIGASVIWSSTLHATNHGNGDGYGDKKGAKTMQVKDSISEALVILSSDSLQTQGMAMVLGNTLAQSGVKVSVLLCDHAGDLALSQSESAMMKPKNVSPKMLLGRLKAQGAKVDVCALYLPNSEHSKADLSEGVGVAKPPEIAALMRNQHVRVFTF